jgi:hypothetical protein
MKTSELKDLALDWAVTVAEGFDPETLNTKTGVVYSLRYGVYTPSTDWAQGGPIVEREGICVFEESDRTWTADSYRYTDLDSPLYSGQGRTPLVAAMRCYVASKLGDEVEIPKELT